MADAVVHIGENSQEGVALKLMQFVRTAGAASYKTKDEILNLYAECLITVRTPSVRS